MVITLSTTSKHGQKTISNKKYFKHHKGFNAWFIPTNSHAFKMLSDWRVWRIFSVTSDEIDYECYGFNLGKACFRNQLTKAYYCIFCWRFRLSLHLHCPSAVLYMIIWRCAIVFTLSFFCTLYISILTVCVCVCYQRDVNSSVLVYISLWLVWVQQSRFRFMRAYVCVFCRNVGGGFIAYFNLFLKNTLTKQAQMARARKVRRKRENRIPEESFAELTCS